MCPDGYVYNVEVEGTHTYLINDGIVAHNCHHATATTYRTIIEHFEDVDPTLRIAGFTATLARGDKAKLSDVWAAPAVTYGISYGIRHGYLLDVRGKRVVVPDLNLANVRKSGGDFQEASLAEELDRTFAPEIVAEAYRKHAADRKGLCFTPTVDSAYQFADAFTQAHIPAAVVHGGLGKLERRLILKRLAGGDVQVVVNCAVLTEGFDDPTISCVVIARPTRSGPLYQQMVGRGLRPDLSLPPETRGDCLVLDVVGASKSHDLRTLVDLSERRIPPEISEDSDLSLTEIEDLSIQIEETNPGPGFELDELYTGQTETIDFDPLGRRTSVGGWLKTDDGTFFLPAGTGAYVLLAPGDMPNTHDVAWITKQAGLSIHGQEAALTEHRGLSLDMACSWAEETMQSLGANLEDELSAARRRRKSKLEPSNRQLAMASTLRMDISRMTRGEATDAILTRLASARIDPVVRAFVSAREKESE